MRVKLNGENLKILICCHKPALLPDNPDGVFLPVFAGAALSDGSAANELLASNWGGARDDMLNGEPCDNISGKNKSFCEMTVIYWAWKNIKKLYPNLEYIGVNHYRRYFSFESNILFASLVSESEDAVRQYTLNLSKLESILSSHDAVMSKQDVFPYSIGMHFSCTVNCADLQTLKRIAHDKFPDYDREMFNVMTHGNKFSPCNMCIMRWDDFDAYCTWAFDILFEAERQIDISAYNERQKRVFGYMAEILLNVWVAHRGLKAKCLPRLKFNDAPNQSELFIAAYRLKCSLAFFFGKTWRKQV